jgi:hypothetical protein
MTEFFIHKESGRITNQQVLDKYLKQLEDGRYKITIKKSTTRTVQQNSWFHAVLPQIMEGLQNIGYNEIRDIDRTKAFVKSIFFKVPVTNGVDTVDIIEPTSKTSKEDWIGREEELINWAHEYLGIDIAPPGSKMTMFE